MKVKKGMFRKIEKVEFQGKEMYLCYPPSAIAVLLQMECTLVGHPADFEDIDNPGMGSLFKGEVYFDNKVIGKVSEIIKIKEVQLEEE